MSVDERVLKLEIRIERWLAISSTFIVCLLAIVGITLQSAPKFVDQQFESYLSDALKGSPHLFEYLNGLGAGEAIETRTKSIEFSGRWAKNNIVLAKDEILLSQGVRMPDLNFKEGLHTVSLYVEYPTESPPVIHYWFLIPQDKVPDDKLNTFPTVELVYSVAKVPELSNERTEDVRTGFTVSWVAFFLAAVLAITQFVFMLNRSPS